MIVRPAEPRDRSVIRTLLLAAFPGAAEADLVEQLRDGGHAEIELVAEEAHELIGHILLSPIEAPFRALGLAPLSVVPARQRRGVGSKLIEQGEAAAREAGWQAIFVLGEPEYYRRFGYSPEAAAPFRCTYSGPHFMMKTVTRGLPAQAGEVRYAPAFATLA